VDDRVQLGSAAVTRVVEWQVDHLPLALFPQTPPEVWHELAAEFSPTFWTDGHWRIALQTWVIEVDGMTVLVDTGAGNDRDRPAMTPLDHLDTDFLGSLQRAGVTPEAVDVVVNTHVHSDHVGWNTQRDNDSWVPTFPNARYVIPEVDYRFFHPDNANHRPPARTEADQARQDQSLTVWADSIAPVDEAGQVELWSDDHQVSESLRLRPAPGHTPGSSVLWLDAGRPAVFVGDVTHCPMQLHRPGDPCAFDEHPAAAAVTRKRVLTDASRQRAPVIPAHYPGQGGVTVVARGDGFMVDDWLEISTV
jgi:glyoxylase-like metal-dependent hydrolase (beta-lactamase superfamily II)